MYKWIRPVLFGMDAESAHRFSLGAARMAGAAGLTRLRSPYRHPAIEQQLWGLTFPNPVGIAAGLDKNAEHGRLWQFLGCGFAEVGSVTARSSNGNARPRVFRLPADGAIVNRMGLNNIGAARVHAGLAAQKRALAIPLGINIAKTNDSSLIGTKAIDDFLISFRLLVGDASYITLNISCPNTEDGKTFESPDSLDELLGSIMSLRSDMESSAPVLVKFSPVGKATDADLGRLVDVALRHNVSGFIATNTTPERPELNTTPEALERIGAGGLSGRPLTERANQTMRMLYRITGGRVPLVGVGGIDSAESAFERILSGASLIQVYTGLVFQGPGLIRRIGRALPQLLDRRGFSTLAEAVGTSAGSV